MRFYAGLALACALAAGAAHPAPRPFTIEDQLSLQDFGRVAVSPDGRWLLAERYGRYQDVARFEHGFLDHQGTSRIYISDLRSDAAARPLLVEDQAAGDTFGAFSPDATLALVFRLKDRRREMGVVRLATGEVIWSGLTTDPDVWNAHAAWRDDHQVVVIARPPEAPSVLLGAGWQTQARTQEAWNAHAWGKYSGVTLGSGRYAPLNPGAATYDLAVFDVPTRSVRVLAKGGFLEMLISPDRRRVALSQEAELTEPSAGGVVRFAYPHRRRRAVLVDLDTGAATRPCPACDLAPTTWAWSPDSQSLVVAARDAPAFDAPYGYWRLAVAGAATRLAPALRVALLGGSTMVNPTGQVVFLGADPTVLATTNDGARTDWWRLTAQGAVNLTTAFGAQGPALAADHDGVLIATASGLVRLAAKGKPRALAASTVAWRAPRDRLPGASGPLFAQVGADQGRLIGTTGQMHLAAALPKEAVLQATSPTGDLVATVTDAHARRSLVLYRPGAPPRTLLSINDDLTEVAFSTPQPVRHTGKAGQALTSWLYLPAGHQAGDERAIILVPYTGDRYDQPPPYFSPGTVFPVVNVQLLVAQGYAVLAPSLPIAPGEEPGAGLAETMLAIVEAAAAQYPGLSRERLALWGQSFGGWSSLMAGSQSPRFKALVATAPATDLITFHSALRPVSLAVPEVGLSLSNMQGWAEGGQGRMGGPPWTRQDRYVRNSPLLHADTITAPVLLAYGDMDFDTTQVTAMFMSLARQGKDAQLLYYRGENHQITNPANVRDLYQRALAFLADALGPVDAAAVAPSAALESRASQ